MQQRTRIELSQLKNEIVREGYSKKLASNLAKTEPAENLEERAKKTQTTIKKAAEATISASRSAKKPWIIEDTLKLADEKRTLKQPKDTSSQKEQYYKDLWKNVKKSSR